MKKSQININFNYMINNLISIMKLLNFCIINRPLLDIKNKIQNNKRKILEIGRVN
jgi:hypothetical protein